MLILLEGADGSGKTTLIKKFLDDGQICKRGLRYEKPSWDYLVAISQSNKKYDVIVDRSFITDMVYRIVTGGDPEDIMLRDAVRILENCTIVYCKTSKMFETSIERGEDNIVNKKTAIEISKTYDCILTLFEKFVSTKILHYDFRQENAYELLKEEIKKLKEVKK